MRVSPLPVEDDHVRYHGYSRPPKNVFVGFCRSERQFGGKLLVDKANASGANWCNYDLQPHTCCLSLQVQIMCESDYLRCCVPVVVVFVVCSLFGFRDVLCYFSLPACFRRS